MESRRAVLVVNSDFSLRLGTQNSNYNLLQFVGPDDSHRLAWEVISTYEAPQDFGYDMMKANVLNVLPGYPLFSPFESMRVIRHLRQDPDSIIVLNDPGYCIGSLLAIFPQDLRDRSYALWRGSVNPFKDYADYYGNVSSKTMINWKLLRWTQRSIGNAVRRNLAISQANAASLMEIGVNPKKITVIQEQIGNEYTPELRKQYGDDFRRQYLKPDELGILVVSRISAEKGLDWVVDLYRHLRQEIKHLHPDSSRRRIKISIAGKDRGSMQLYQAELDKDIAEARSSTIYDYNSEGVKIEFVGELDRSQLQERYNAYDLLFMPSPAEGFGRVVVEAMQASMPVIVRESCRATNEIITRADCAVGVSIKNPQEAAIIILNLMSRPEDLQQLSENAARWSHGYYTIERAEREFLAAIK